MKKTIIATVLGALLISFIIVSCKKNDQPPAVQNTHTVNFYTNSLSGFGTHGGFPSGNTFVLPSNIKVIGSMRGGDPGYKSGSKTPKTIAYIPELPKSNYIPYGLGTYVNVYAKFYNTSPYPYKLIIPSGVILCDSIPNDSIPVDTSQSGVIIPPDTIPIPGNDSVDVCMKSFCLNLHHAAPSSQNIYRFTVITNNEQLHNLVAILKNKKTLADHVSEIQGVIWDLTDNGGITQADWNMVNSWN